MEERWRGKVGARGSPALDSLRWKTLLNLTARAVPLLQENQKVKKDLLEAQTNIAFLQSELDALKSDYADQSLNSERYETLHFIL